MLPVFLSLWSLQPMSDEKPTMVAPSSVEEHRIVACSAPKLPAKAAYHWTVTGPGPVSRATTTRDRCEWVAPPGTYSVTLLVIRIEGDTPTVDEYTATVTIRRAAPPVVPPPPPPPADPVATARKAIVRIQSGNAGCTATVIGEARPNGSHTLLTAAHCLKGVGAVGTVWLNDGTKAAFRCEAWDAKSDLAWLVTDGYHSRQPYLSLATAAPKVGDTVFHAGFGVDRPANVEEGRVTAAENTDGQIRFRLSVSSGDSGGGICLTKSGEVLAAVCCTTAPGREGDVWGGSARRAAEIRPVPVLSDRTATEWTPIPIPTRTPSVKAER